MIWAALDWFVTGLLVLAFLVCAAVAYSMIRSALGGNERNDDERRKG